MLTQEQIERTVEYDPVGGCWLWPLNYNGQGYCRYQNQRVHRLSFEAYIGPIPDGFVIDHKCRVRCCVNPQHLRAVTPRINAVENNIGPTAANAVKTHCPKGHALTLDNIKWQHRHGSRKRICLICARETSRIYMATVRARKKETAGTVGRNARKHTALNSTEAKTGEPG